MLVTDRLTQARRGPTRSLPTYVVPAMVDAIVDFLPPGSLARAGVAPTEPGGDRRGPRSPAGPGICPKLSIRKTWLLRIGDVFGIDAILAGPECPDPLSAECSAFDGRALRLPGPSRAG